MPTLATPSATEPAADVRAPPGPRCPRHRPPDHADPTRCGRAEAECLAIDPTSPNAISLCRDVLALDLAAGGNGHLSRGNLVDVGLASGDARAAAQTGEALLADLQGGRDAFALAYARLNLVAATLALGDLARARPLAQVGWPQGRSFGHQAYWADHLALLAALEARAQAVARLAGYGRRAYGEREWDREANEAAAHARACALARAALGDAGFDRLHAEGQRLGEAQIEAIAFAATDG